MHMCYSCYIQVVDISCNPELGNELGLIRLNYHKLYPENWAGDRNKEEFHKSVFLKMITWPFDDKNMVSS